MKSKVRVEARIYSLNSEFKFYLNLYPDNNNSARLLLYNYLFTLYQKDPELVITDKKQHGLIFMMDKFDSEYKLTYFGKEAEDKTPTRYLIIDSL